MDIPKIHESKKIRSSIPPESGTVTSSEYRISLNEDNTCLGKKRPRDKILNIKRINCEIANHTSTPSGGSFSASKSNGINTNNSNRMVQVDRNIPRVRTRLLIN